MITVGSSRCLCKLGCTGHYYGININKDLSEQVRTFDLEKSDKNLFIYLLFKWKYLRRLINSY